MGIRYQKSNKYHAKKTTVDGITFDSKKEAQRYIHLRLLRIAGKIKNLELQKKFVLIPAQYDSQGKLLERECSYVADFCYIDTTNSSNYVVEDVKGVHTNEYIIKRKLMLFVHNIAITEV